MAKKSQNEILNNLVDYYKMKASKDFDKVITQVNDEMYDEAIKMYDTFITQYYSYKTSSYVRYGETRPGTGMGTRLFYGQNITKNNHKHTLTIDISGDDLSQDSKPYKDDPDFVMMNVFSGYRGIPGFWLIDWTGEYNGKYFSYKGTMKDAFSQFGFYFTSIARESFLPKWRKLGWK